MFLYWNLSCRPKLPGATITASYFANVDDVSVYVMSSVEFEEVNKETGKYEGMLRVEINCEKFTGFAVGFMEGLCPSRLLQWDWWSLQDTQHLVLSQIPTGEKLVSSWVRFYGISTVMVF